MTITIDGERALALLDRAIELRGGDTVVNLCQYVRNTDNELVGCCIVGTGLADLGVPLTTLLRMDGLLASAAGVAIDSPLIAEILARTADVVLTPEGLAVLKVAQFTQDRFSPWSLARADAAGALEQMKEAVSE